MPSVKLANEFDPPLTTNGLKQAQATAYFLKSYFIGNDYEFDKIII